MGSAWLLKLVLSRTGTPVSAPNSAIRPWNSGSTAADTLGPSGSVDVGDRLEAGPPLGSDRHVEDHEGQLGGSRNLEDLMEPLSEHARRERPVALALLYHRIDPVLIDGRPRIGDDAPVPERSRAQLRSPLHPAYDRPVRQRGGHPAAHLGDPVAPDRGRPGGDLGVDLRLVADGRAEEDRRQAPPGTDGLVRGDHRRPHRRASVMSCRMGEHVLEVATEQEHPVVRAIVRNATGDTQIALAGVRLPMRNDVACDPLQ